MTKIHTIEKSLVLILFKFWGLIHAYFFSRFSKVEIGINIELFVYFLFSLIAKVCNEFAQHYLNFEGDPKCI